MRKYVQHTDRGQFLRELMLAAVELVQNRMSIRKAAKEQCKLQNVVKICENSLLGVFLMPVLGIQRLVKFSQVLWRQT